VETRFLIYLGQLVAVAANKVLLFGNFRFFVNFVLVLLVPLMTIALGYFRMAKKIF
jgi:hypothetical protein